MVEGPTKWEGEAAPGSRTPDIRRMGINKAQSHTTRAMGHTASKAATLKTAAISRMEAIETTEAVIWVETNSITTISSLTSKTIQMGKGREGKVSKTVGLEPQVGQVGTRKKEEEDITVTILTIITTMAKKWISLLSKDHLTSNQILKPSMIFHQSIRNKILEDPHPTLRNSKKT